MRIFLIICIILGILIPAMVIYTDHKIVSNPVPFDDLIITPIAQSLSTPETPTLELLTIEPAYTTTPTPVITYIPTPTTVYAPHYNIDTLSIPYLQDKEQVKAFMLYDQTDKEVYRQGFRCIQYCREVRANAEKIGVVCDILYIMLEDYQSGHAILEFPTMYDGLIYVDPTCGDWWVELEYGEREYDSYSMTDPDKHWFYNETLVYHHDYS